MRQLALQIQSAAPPTLDNFVCGRNAEALAALRLAVASPARETLLYLWGPDGSGKSHLLAALDAGLRAAGRPALRVAGRRQPLARELLGEAVLGDDVEALSPDCAEQLFHAWNRIREQGGALVCTGQQAPNALPLAPELASRLAWGAVYRLQALDDAEKLQALRTRASAQGIPVADEALGYLLARARRDLPSLMLMLDQLDEFSLSTKRAITVPLVRELLQQQDGNKPMESLCD